MMFWFNSWKAGVITLSDGSRTSFIGSVNETYSAWKLNYEIMWEDDSEASVTWVQEEFDYFGTVLMQYPFLNL